MEEMNLMLGILNGFLCYSSYERKNYKQACFNAFSCGSFLAAFAFWFFLND